MTEEGDHLLPKEQSEKPQLKKKHCDGTLKELVADTELLKNLICVTILWTICNVNFFLNKFMIKYVSGDIFLNGVL